MKYLFIALMSLSACSLYEKNQSGDELKSMTDEVLKKNEGIDIQVKPIPKGT